jgi:heme-degrading monooxygenase HmoA
MVKFANLDDEVSVVDQLAESDAPVILVNMITVAPEDEEAAIEVWRRDAEFMKRQPGFISTQLHRGIGASSTFMNHAVWESVANFRAAFQHPDFRAQIADYPASVVVRPHLFRKVAVPGICVAG